MSKYEPPRIPRLLIGVNTKLGVNECWIALFLENERRYAQRYKAGAKKPRTDKQLAAFLRQEFPERQSEVWEHVALVRWRYNNARLYKNQKIPKLKSFRYSTSGKRIAARAFDADEAR